MITIKIILILILLGVECLQVFIDTLIASNSVSAIALAEDLENFVFQTREKIYKIFEIHFGNSWIDELYRMIVENINTSSWQSCLDALYKIAFGVTLILGFAIYGIYKWISFLLIIYAKL